MHLHILGICGTFMGSLAILARDLGHTVTGSDANVYPPMSTLLESQGISILSGYDAEQLDPEPDLVVIGNALSRGNPAVEAVLNRGLNYCSGPEWLQRHVLRDRWVLACAGTHGKTTCSSMLAWVLEYANMAPGFLIGGVPRNFDRSARLGETPFFVIEADEYDSAFFDKRSKFVHYRPRTAILNNLEYDHADIFPDLASIQRQFHHLIRTIPGDGQIIVPAEHRNLDAVLDMGCWTQVMKIGSASVSETRLSLLEDDGSRFSVSIAGHDPVTVDWEHCGQHNVDNALAVIAAARHVGVSPELSAEALSRFRGVKRRMELRGTVAGIEVYDDFAHHPTAIETTLAGLRAKNRREENGSGGRILAVIEPRSNTMRMGVHGQQLSASCAAADHVFWYQPPNVNWDMQSLLADAGERSELWRDLGGLIDRICALATAGDRIVIMSNGGFGGIHTKLLDRLQQADNRDN